jgi:hypothetical protein
MYDTKGEIFDRSKRKDDVEHEKRAQRQDKGRRGQQGESSTRPSKKTTAIKEKSEK